MTVLEPLADGIRALALRTPTLPPATHTNCYVVGRTALTVIEPASPWADEQDRLVEALEADGARVERILLTHHHPDHVGGAIALRDALAAKGRAAPIVAHASTRDLLVGAVVVDEVIADGDVLRCGGVDLHTLHTPGHAPGHVVLHDRASGAVVAGDMVAGVGTILIDPFEGDLGHYLDSLERMRGLSASQLLPAHGDPIVHADAMLGFYIAHRHQRSAQIQDALRTLGEVDALAIARQVYGVELPDAALPLAAIQVTAHLLWLARHGRADGHPGGVWRAA
jgi:glyoxylase-like metal-dependent hydrolase (beta-lactamase superfamily II)